MALGTVALVGSMVAASPGLANADATAIQFDSPYTNTTKSLLTPALRAAGDGPWTPALRLPPLAARKGQKYYLETRLAATSNVPRGPMMGARIVCLATGGGAGSPYTTRNHSGRAHGTQSVIVRWVFTAPANNTYRCEVRGRAHTSLEPQKATLHLKPTSYLRVRLTSSGSRQWADVRDACTGTQVIPDHPACAKASKNVRVLARTIGVGLAPSFTAAADVELTREYGAYPGGTSEVRSTLRLVQLDRNGDACTDARSTSKRRSIDSDIHHRKVHLTLSDVPVRRTGGCVPWFRIQVNARSLAGNPVLIHNQVYSNAFVLLNPPR